VVRATAGHAVEAFLACARIVDAMYRVEVPEAADLVIASAGDIRRTSTSIRRRRR